MKKRNPFSPIRTKYVGVYHIVGTGPDGKPQKVFYISYYRDGKRHFEPVGREGEQVSQEDKRIMSAAVANQIRADKVRGKKLPNRERRAVERAEAEAQAARWTIRKLAKEYFEHRERRKNIRVDRNLYDRYLAEDFDDKMPEQVDPLSLDRFKKKLSQRKSLKGEKGTLSPVTVRNALAMLRQIVTFGTERQLTKGFPGKVPVPRVSAKLAEDDLTPSQLSALLAALDAEVDQDGADAVRLALYTGARREEILRLRWPDVDLDRGLWRLRDRKAGGDAGFPLSAQARAVLKKRKSSRSTVSEYVFPGGGKLGYLRDPRSAFDRIKAAAGLPAKFRILHGCRHHYATMLVADGVDLLTVARLLGHVDAQMVMRRYAHVRPGVLAQAAERSGKLIEQAAASAKKKQGEASNE